MRLLLVLVLFAVAAATTRGADAAQTTRQAEEAQRPAPASPTVRGTAIDRSGGVLPGVSVVARQAGGRVLAATITDDAGEYAFASLPPGPAELVFQLDGFVTAVVRVTIHPGADLEVLERLDLAPVAETVEVRGQAPAPPPPISPPPVLTPVPAHDQESVCGPAKAGAALESLGTIRARRNEAKPGLYAKGDELVIDGGTMNGLEAGLNVVVRRHYRVRPSWDASEGRDKEPLTGEHTSGLLQIVAAGESVSTAVVVYACDEIMKGDFLASFVPEPTRALDPAGTPNYANAGRILFADAGQMIGVPRRLMVIDQGTELGIRRGQRLTIFRRPAKGGWTHNDLGEAVVVAVRADSATIRVVHATDAILFGDMVALQRPVRPAAAVDARLTEP